MEYDRQGPYSVLTRDEVKPNMKKQIDEISQIFSVSESDATVLLMYLGWDSLQVSNCLIENKEKVLSESGLKSFVIDSSQVLSGISCGICFKIGAEIDDGDLISTPFCAHKFCKTCWREYLHKSFYSVEKNQTSISCPDRDCRAAVGPDPIKKLTVHDQEMYERYMLRSYLEGNQALMIKQCPARDCDYAIEFHRVKDEEYYCLNVVCLCGHTFCRRCRLESHRPVTCNTAFDWLSKDLRPSLSLSLIETNTKLFPCRDRFMKCMQSEEDHKTEAGIYKAYDVRTTFGTRAEVDISCVKRWAESQVLMKQAKSDLQAFEESNIKKPSHLSEKDIWIIRKGLMLILQCRQVLKWTCVYDYFHAEYEISKREYLRFLQGNATALVQSYSETLKEETERALSVATSQKLDCVMHKVSIETSNIGNYFYHFIKTLEEGLNDVKVKSYDDYGGLFWLCDRCTFGNTWFHKECKMCRDATAFPVELSDLSHN